MRLDSETLRTPQNFVSQIEVSIFLFRNCRCSVTYWNAIFHKMSQLTQAGFNLAPMRTSIKFCPVLRVWNYITPEQAIPRHTKKQLCLQQCCGYRSLESFSVNFEPCIKRCGWLCTSKAASFRQFRVRICKA